MYYTPLRSLCLLYGHLVMCRIGALTVMKQALPGSAPTVYSAEKHLVLVF